ncbi:sirohydrochlorin cobaltochelatase [Streptococcus catagoni]|uniref:sirohydrochlorin cobaltochelatase n=1 Tax=Streptococcus catagoni TaxID=2654874 RepID=UPI001409BD3C|nr:sirohydrochlorin cobaltochelatase [Streptococcus catagoni]
MTKAILVVSFGTTHADTRQKTIKACEKAIKRRFPAYLVESAFTSTVVIRRIKEQEGLLISTVKEALESLKSRGIKEVYIQPLHIILGQEFEKILCQAKAFKTVFDKIEIGKPLLNTMADYQAVKDTLLKYYQPKDSHSATVLMGHGSRHYAFTAYSALDHMLDASSVYLACVESYPYIELIEEKLAKKNIKKVKLAPFMLVAGEHAKNDMTSEEADSWYCFFKERGYELSTELTGLGEFPEIKEQYIRHLEEIIKE